MTGSIEYTITIDERLDEKVFIETHPVRDPDRSRQVCKFCLDTYSAGFVAGDDTWYPPHRIHEISWKEAE